MVREAVAKGFPQAPAAHGDGVRASRANRRFLRRLPSVVLTLFPLILYLPEELVRQPCLYCSVFLLAQATLGMEVAKF